MKKKMLVDLELARIKDKDTGRLTEREKEAIKFYEDHLYRLEKNYKEAITQIVSRFTSKIHEVFKNVQSIVQKESEESSETLILLQ